MLDPEIHSLFLSTKTLMALDGPLSLPKSWRLPKRNKPNKLTFGGLSTLDMLHQRGLGLLLPRHKPEGEYPRQQLHEVAYIRIHLNEIRKMSQF